MKRLLATVDKDGLATLNLSEIMLFAAPLVKHRHARMEIMRRYKAFNENPVVDKFGKPVPKVSRMMSCSVAKQHEAQSGLPVPKHVDCRSGDQFSEFGKAKR